ncbi:MAG TPA: thiamine-phosphate kinase [Nitrosospira sp.]|nr:thiamine-phosphate kinase [Nitrosospira sp.]
MLSEFDLIERYFTPPAPRTVLGVGDDAALIKPAAGMELAISSDMLVCGRHFFDDADPYKLGHKSLAVNLSDMAAMGASPRWAILSLALPASIVEDEAWLKAFARGFLELAHSHQVDLIGGDTTNGPLNICVAMVGEVRKGKALRRSGARPGDDIWVSGHLGNAALALAHLQQRITLATDDLEKCLAALHTPVPRVSLGQRLIGLAHSAIDISDGLLADLGHILKRSKAAAVIRMDAIRRSATMEKHLPHSLAVECLLTGGDDYELCFTAPKSKRARIEKLADDQGIPLSCIGRIKEGEGLLVQDAAGKTIIMEIKGYEHFRA